MTKIPLLLRRSQVRDMVSYVSDFGSAVVASLCGIASRGEEEENDEEEKEEENEESVPLTTTWDAVSRFYYVNGNKNEDNINK